jgi:hypothetical protein
MVFRRYRENKTLKTLNFQGFLCYNFNKRRIILMSFILLFHIPIIFINRCKLSLTLYQVSIEYKLIML